MSLANPMFYASFAFAVLILLEALLDIWLKSREYEVKDTIVNIIMGNVSQLWGLLWKVLQGFIYVALYELSPLRMPSNAIWAWVALFILDDFLYYWFHRISHESRFFWNFHVVHHSSERYNLSVAVRQSWFSGLADWVFYLPLALLGFPLWMRVAAHAWNLIYQFWIHTPFIKSLGPLEAVLNTPAHHRVHHAVNEPYLDKNYGGILIIWDRIFGSFVPETEPPRYGIIKPLNSFNPLWANLHGWAEMFAAMREKKTWRDKLRCVWGPPAMVG
jgi:sterol desaturase/sphingolipid hydroxylase (fatty acid hydroxylase superfamily)